MSVYRTQRLRKYRKWLANEPPLIGGCLRRLVISPLIEDSPAEETIALAEAAMRVGLETPFMITHSSGHIFLTDVPNSALAAF